MGRIIGIDLGTTNSLAAFWKGGEAYLGEPVEEAVVSVPAYFGDEARRVTPAGLQDSYYSLIET